ncbi:haloacid dehalogenase [Colletotrichum orchidophilum]|uniref:Haloacid dehalogenase n=1 Tax=Colletotrichum orchidophilum TaxID=1209926 RepID=A0A1G4B9J4_9PEZI|nr:haloacid dehalogenase [Colletotrichum orchidophilum]OHE97952.1 haloacid dehalogenase [Colletotrichum orchidophilum]
MASLKDFRVLTFDVYGTLIDWETGVLTALQPLLDDNKRTDFSRKQLLDAYHECEVKQQSATPGLPYSQLLTAIHPQIAAKLGLASAPSAEASKAFGNSVGDWPAFPDTVDALRRLGTHYKLVVLSNVDRASFALSNAGPLAGVPFDLVITAQDVGSYKPDQRNFEYMLREVKEKFGVERQQVLQTAQSQFHDHHPAQEAGIKSSWIVRPGAVMGNRDREVYDWKFDTLGLMADSLEKELA